VLEESEVPSSWPEESSPKAPEIAPEAPEAPFEDLKEKASGLSLGGGL
jgi:hypothetical protein